MSLQRPTSEQITFTPSGTGAVATTQEEVNRRRVSVFDFMTDAQRNDAYLRFGLINSSDAINAAINVVFAAGGGFVEVPSGKYRTDSPIIPKNGVTLISSSAASRVNGAESATIIYHYGNNSGVLIQTPTSVTDITIIGIEFDGVNSGAVASGITMDAQTNGGAIYGIKFKDCTIANFTNYQVLQNGTVFDITFDGCSLHNYDRAAGDCYHVGPNGVPGQQNFINCFFIPVTANQWAFRAEAACDPRFIGGTIGPSNAAANGIDAFGALYVYGTHIEGFSGSTATGIRYKGSTGAFISPSECISFAIGIQIGDGTSDTARGWTIAGCVGANSAQDILITAGGPRGGTICETGSIGGTRIIQDNRLITNGIAEVCLVDSTFPTVNKRTFTPSIIGLTSAGTATYSTQQGYYSRTGNVVEFSIWLNWSGHTGTGQASITGLPFAADSGIQTSLDGFRIENFAIGANNILQSFISGGTSFNLETASTAGGASAALNVPAAGSLMVSGKYFVA